MKASLIYTLPEEREEYEDAVNGSKYKSILFDLDQWLRSKYKYEDLEEMRIQTVRQHIANLCQEAGVDLW